MGSRGSRPARAGQPGAAKLLGVVIVRDLTDVECRRAAADVARLKLRNLPVPLDVRLRFNEYVRRKKSGEYERLKDRGGVGGAPPPGEVP